MFIFRLFIFSLMWCGVIYGYNSLIAKKPLKIQLRPMITYVLTMASLGLFGEVMYGIIYNAAIGTPLWQYQIMPIHNGYTSVYSLYLWGMVGFHLYLLHATLKSKGITSTHKLAFIFCIEAIILEALVNLSFMAVFGGFIYYYLPSDLWHITSVQTLPLYLLAGYIVVTAMRLARRTPRYALLGNSAVIIALLALK